MLPCFDIGIVGGGCAGLQLLQQLSLHEKISEQKIILFDDEKPKQQSWCFWAKREHPLQHLVSKSWNNLRFCSDSFCKTESITPYAYHYISAENFYSYFKEKFIPNHPNIAVVNTRVNGITKDGHGFLIYTEHEQWQVKKCFSSLIPKAFSSEVKLWQHFKGWYIETEHDVFDDRAATLMDFSMSDSSSVNFIYQLPFSKKIALFEATFFSGQIAADEVYELLIRQYFIKNYPGCAYQIKSVERGIVPMTTTWHGRYGVAGEVLIGTAAGMVKASAGYAFNRIAKDSHLLSQSIAQNQPYFWRGTKGRYKFYDDLFLNMIQQNPEYMADVFTRLFGRNRVIDVLRFLDEETSFFQEAAIFSTMPVIPFVVQAVKYFLK